MRGFGWFGVACLGLAAVVSLVWLGASPDASRVASASEAWPGAVRAQAASFSLPVGAVLHGVSATLRTQSNRAARAAEPTSGTRPTAPSPSPIAVPSPTSQPPTATATRSKSQLLERTFFSPALGRTMHYYVYLPAGYAESGQRYATLYLLHGRNTLGTDRGSDTEWITLGLPQAADATIAAGDIPPMIVVMPQGDAGYWMNHANGGPRWGDYAAQDVVTHIDATYRTVPDTPHRAVGGLSMGGHGALQLAMNYPGTFGVVGAHSPTLRSFGDREPFFGDAAYFAAHDPASLVRRYPERARALKMYLDVGKQDNGWRGAATALDDLLTAQGIPHTFQLLAGDHSKEYWRSHCAEYLRFYGANLAPPQ